MSAKKTSFSDKDTNEEAVHMSTEVKPDKAGKHLKNFYAVWEYVRS